MADNPFTILTIAHIASLKYHNISAVLDLYAKQLHADLMLDSAGYLISLGWAGKGNGLRQGSVSRPLAIPQKRTLSGVGKDRDEAYPFWDHLFTAAAKSIKINISGDDDASEASDTSADPSSSTFLRTSTGILSNRRPVSSTPASGSVTPSELDPHSMPRLSLLAAAKRESARNRLYAGFFRGPVLGPDIDPNQTTMPSSVPSLIDSDTQAITAMSCNCDVDDRKRKHDNLDQSIPMKKVKKAKKMKHKDSVSPITIVEEQRKKHRDPEVRTKLEEADTPQISSRKDCTGTAGERYQRKAAKIERRKRKEERRKAKEGRRG